MRNPTRLVFNTYLSRIAELNGIEDPTKQFNADPSVQQTLETRIQESSDLLSRINMIGVTEQQGQKLGLGVSGPASSRTNTDNGPRQTRDLSTIDPNGYNCVQTNFDTHIKYAQLDAWAKFQDFQIRVTNARIARQKLDRIMIGFNGTSIAADTNLATNPLLQDVNKGWLQHYRENAPARVMKEGAQGSGKITVGVGGNYGNLDALVYDLCELLDPWYQDDTRLVAFVGRDILHDKYFPLVNSSDKATEKVAVDTIMSSAKRLGGLPAVRVPFFIPGGVFVTAYENLSLYWQEGSRRSHVKEAPERSRVEFYESSNDAYVIEDYGFGAMAENIELVDGD